MKKEIYLKSLMQSGVNAIYNNYPKIDKLNVFPVPDGDTGTNMNLTCTNGFDEIKEDKTSDYKTLLKKFARGLIIGARGNSGVIFSQIVKGFSVGMDKFDDMSVPAWKECFIEAKNFSYSAVMKPVEGTILTVIREISEKVVDLDDDIDLVKFWEFVIKEANASLERTPTLLKALKDAGVVDSGGFGLVKFLEGIENFVKTGKIVNRKKKLESNSGGNVDFDIEDEFGYCTEAIVMLNDGAGDTEKESDITISIIRDTLEGYGNTSMVVVRDDDILKVHTHAISPGQVLNYLQQFGEFKTIKVENMTLQADHQIKGGNPAIKKEHSTIKKVRDLSNPFATIGVVRSSKMKEYFKEELGMDFVINGGSKMNPSTNDFLKAIEIVNAKVVYIFPNDSNVFLAAKAAKDLENKSKVVVIPTNSVVEGMAAFLNLDPNETPKRNEVNILKELKNVTTYAVSKAARDALVDGVNVKAGTLMSIINKKVSATFNSYSELLTKSFSKLVTNKVEIITIFVGLDVEEEDVVKLRKFLDEKFNVEYEIIESDQEVYPFIIGIEYSS